jgi:hypothetical protein
MEWILENKEWFFSGAGIFILSLVERASTPERNIHQIVLDESLTVAAKLTTEQMDALTVNFLLSKTKNHTLVNIEAINKYLDQTSLPLVFLLKSS